MTPIFPSTGYIAQLRLFGVPTHIHWTFPAGGLYLAWFLGDLSITMALSAILAYTTLILIHELGHAFFALRASCRVHAMVVTATGGFCVSDLPTRWRDRLGLYAGGLLAQSVLFVITVGFVALFGKPQSNVAGLFVAVFTLVNALIFVANAVPYGSNDGARILAVMRERRR